MRTVVTDTGIKYPLATKFPEEASGYNSHLSPKNVLANPQLPKVFYFVHFEPPRL